MQEGEKLPIVGGTLVRGMKQLTGEGDFLAFAARGYDKY